MLELTSAGNVRHLQHAWLPRTAPGWVHADDTSAAGARSAVLHACPADELCTDRSSPHADPLLGMLLLLHKRCCLMAPRSPAAPETSRAQPRHWSLLQAKAYTTRVGAGAYPTEIKGSLAETLREKGGEYGTTTGRPRRVGWLDIPALNYATRCGTLGSSGWGARCLVGKVVVSVPNHLGLPLGEAMYPCR